ncbi:MAG: aspartate aminotransferase family protein, partial [Rhodospirillaceae bacterium]|nr:aspartate aminotransferase family protein [Rhodospirillaceae bacterium]
DLALLEQTVADRAADLAAIIIEPITCNTGVIEPRPGYLEGLRRLCDKNGIVLIFDEVITGFRAALGGAQARYGVTPDLAVFAKAAAAGFPISIVAGRRDIMEGVTSGVLHGGTYNGLTSTVAACAATVEQLAQDGGAPLKKMEARGRDLMEGLNTLGRKHGLALHAQGIGTVFSTVFTGSPPLNDYRDYKASDETLRLEFVEELQNRDVRTTTRGTWFVSSELSDEDVRTTLEAADDALAVLASR